MTAPTKAALNRADYVVSVSVGMRIAYFLLLLSGVFLIAFAFSKGGGALLLAPAGIAIVAFSLWLLSRKGIMLPPARIAKQLDARLAQEVGEAAATPEARHRYVAEYHAAQSPQSVSGIWEFPRRRLLM